MASLTLEGVTKRFGTQAAVHQVDLEVREGEFITLLGPSGCGKTTTLRMVAGFETPDDGRILIDGRDVSRVPAQQRNVGMVFQDYALFPHLTILENVEFPLRERRVPKGERRRRALEFLDLVQLPHPQRYPSEISGGQQQRVALARALVYGPSILLMDEPLGALDLKLRELMQFEIKRIQEQLRITTLYVTHDQSEALTMSDRIMVMNGGHALQCGTPEDIYGNPRDQFVADFVGQTNFLDGTIERDGTLRGADGAAVRLAPDTSVAEPTRVRAAVRLEAVRLSAAAPEDSAWPCCVGRISGRKFLGSRIHYFVQVGEWKIVAESTPDAKRWSDGDNVFVTWSPLHLTLWKR
jgi:spermidine/putrescine transport system ATP-binding protein